MRVLFIATILFLFSGAVQAQDETSGDEASPGDDASSETEASPAGDVEAGAEEEPSPDEGEAGEEGEADVADASEEGPAEEEASAGESAEEGEPEPEGEPAGEEGEGEEEVDPASEPPEVSAEPDGERLNTRLSGRLRSEIFMTQRPRMKSLGAGVYGVRSVNVFPFYETIELRADEIGHKGLSIHFQGWAGLDLADIYFDQRIVADPTYLYLQFRDYGADIKIGRQMVYSGATRGLHLDGIYASYESPIHLGIEAHGGLVVSPYRGPEWYREQPGNLSYDDFGAGFSDWEREGDYAVGGRVFYRLAGKVSAGVSVLHVTEFDEVDRQLFGVDLDMTPLKWFGATGNATMDIMSTKLQEANLGMDFYPHETVSISADYRHADPTLYLSHLSIFSVFSMEEYDAVGGVIRLKPLGWLQFHAGYHHRFYSYVKEEFDDLGDSTYGADTDTGYDIDAGAIIKYGAKGAGMVLLDYNRLGEDEQGIHALRLGTIIPMGVEGLRTSVNVYLDFYDEEINDSDLGFMADLGLFYGNRKIEAGGSVAAGLTPYAESEVRGMLKLNYNFDVSFVERREQ